MDYNQIISAANDQKWNEYLASHGIIGDDGLIHPRLDVSKWPMSHNNPPAIMDQYSVDKLYEKAASADSWRDAAKSMQEAMHAQAEANKELEQAIKDDNMPRRYVQQGGVTRCLYGTSSISAFGELEKEYEILERLWVATEKALIKKESELAVTKEYAAKLDALIKSLQEVKPVSAPEVVPKCSECGGLGYWAKYPLNGDPPEQEPCEKCLGSGYRLEPS